MAARRGEFDCRNNPDGNGVELHWDRPRELWPRSPAGAIAIGILLLIAELELERICGTWSASCRKPAAE